MPSLSAYGPGAAYAGGPTQAPPKKRPRLAGPQPYGPASAYAGGITGSPSTPGYGANGVRQAPSPFGLANALQAPGGGSYDDAFKSSLAKSRAGIESQFGAALADISAREGVANQALGTLGPEVQGIYDRGNANLGQAQQAMDSAQAASGLTSYAPASAQMAPIAASIGQDLAARQADVPLLKLGSTQVFTQQRGGLNQARMGAMGELDSEERSYSADQAARQEERAYQESQKGDDLAGQDWLAQQDFRRQQQAAQMDSRSAMAEEGRSLNNFGAADITPDRGQWLHNYDPENYQRILQGDDYKWAEKRLKSTKSKQGVHLFDSVLGGGKEKYDVGDVVKDLQRRGKYRTAAIFAYRHKKGRVGAPAVKG